MYFFFRCNNFRWYSFQIYKKGKKMIHNKHTTLKSIYIYNIHKNVYAHTNNLCLFLWSIRRNSSNEMMHFRERLVKHCCFNFSCQPLARSFCVCECGGFIDRAQATYAGRHRNDTVWDRKRSGKSVTYCDFPTVYILEWSVHI